MVEWVYVPKIPILQQRDLVFGESGPVMSEGVPVTRLGTSNTIVTSGRSYVQLSSDALLYIEYLLRITGLVSLPTQEEIV